MRTLYTETCSPDEIAAILDKPLLQENPAVESAVRGILADVRQRGDEAVLEYTRRFDWPDADSVEVPREELEQGHAQVSESLLSAIRVSKANIERFHRKQLRESWFDESQPGKLLGQVIRPIERVGALVPGFLAPLPSSLLMTVVPAKVAGVEEVFVCTPPRKDGSIHPATAAAAIEAGADRVFRIGGAQAVATLAYGTATVPRVDKIVGPGNVYVTMAKRFVYGQVGIEMLAGPSEVLVLADETADPRHVAADMLSQAEHDPDARALLVTPSQKLADAVNAEIERQLDALTRNEIARKCLDDNGAIIIVSDMDEAVGIANRVAPEHLEVSVADPLALLPRLKNAGAILLGDNSTEPIGDYIAGPSHVLPTSGTARFSSPLNVDDFLKKSSVVMYSKEALLADAAATIELAETEGLDAHANAVRVRLDH
ncbi:MAG: histidinol dehydrogenase [Armatimonadetes bacterium]|nr:histidinol dehydrogenase [Armatimonadota bacterium]